MTPEAVRHQEDKLTDALRGIVEELCENAEWDRWEDPGPDEPINGRGPQPPTPWELDIAVNEILPHDVSWDDVGELEIDEFDPYLDHITASATKGVATVSAQLKGVKMQKSHVVFMVEMAVSYAR